MFGEKSGENEKTGARVCLDSEPFCRWIRPGVIGLTGAAIGQPAAIIDCFGILSDIQIRQYFELGCEVKGLGRGHIQRIKDEVRRG